MITVEERETIRRAYYLEGKSKRQIAREYNHSRKTVDKAVDNRPPQPYRLTRSKPSPVFGAYRERADALLAENARLPQKQQYTGHKIYEILQAEGYQGSEARVRLHMTQWNKNHTAPALFLPLSFDPGQDAQADWGEAVAIIGGVKQTVQVFVMWLSYSRRRFVMAFPSQKQESFFYGHVRAFEHFGGVPWRMSYDNLSTAVRGTRGGQSPARTSAVHRLSLVLPVREPFLSTSSWVGEGWGRGIGRVQSEEFPRAHP
jgi:transposase